MGLGVVERLLAAVDWEREAYPTYDDFLALPFFVLFFPTVRFFLDRFVFERVARKLIFKKGQEKADYEIVETRKKIRKFKESAWKCIYFLSGELLSLSVTYNEPWFTNTKYFWVGPGEQVWPDQKIKLKLKAVYMYAAGFYAYSIFALMFWETRRSDFGVSMSHHVATVVLIILSYVFRFARVGSLVLAIHDASDVFLEVGKMAKYSHCDWLANVAFLLFVVSWVVLRLTYFPFWILRSTSDRNCLRFYKLLAHSQLPLKYTGYLLISTQLRHGTNMRKIPPLWGLNRGTITERIPWCYRRIVRVSGIGWRIRWRRRGRLRIRRNPRSMDIVEGQRRNVSGCRTWWKIYTRRNGKYTLGGTKNIH